MLYTINLLNEKNKRTIILIIYLCWQLGHHSRPFLWAAVSEYVDSSPLLPRPSPPPPTLLLPMMLLMLLTLMNTFCLVTRFHALLIFNRGHIVGAWWVVKRCLCLAKKYGRFECWHIPTDSVVTSMQGLMRCLLTSPYSVLTKEGVTDPRSNKNMLIKRTITHYLLVLTTQPSLVDLRQVESFFSATIDQTRIF